jgi:hypothetical protein
MKSSKPPDLSKMEAILDDSAGPHHAQILPVGPTISSEVLTDEMIESLIESGASTGRQEVILDDYGHKPVNRLLGGKQ